MENRFENFTITVLKLNKLIQRIKLIEMEEYGLKAVHVMCVYYLHGSKQGLTAAELCKLTFEDKAAISRALALLKGKGFISYDTKTYNASVKLTEEGEKLYDYIDERAAKAVDAGGSHLTDEERTAFYRAIGSIAENLTAYYENLKKK